MVRRSYKESNNFNPPGTRIIKLPSPPVIPNIPIRQFEFNQTSNVYDDVVSAGVDYAEDKCNIIVNVSAYSSFHARSLQFTYIYRKPECVLELPQQEDEIPIPIDGQLPNVPQVESTFWLFCRDTYEYSQGVSRSRQEWVMREFKSYVDRFESVDEYFPGLDRWLSVIHWTTRQVFTAEHNGKWIEGNLSSEGIEERLENGTLEILNMGESYYSPETVYRERTISIESGVGRTNFFNFNQSYYWHTGNRASLINWINDNPWANYDNRYVNKRPITITTYNASNFPYLIPGKYPKRIPIDTTGSDIYGNYYSGTLQEAAIDINERMHVILPVNTTYQSNPKKPPILPPPPPPMTCNCCPNIQQNDALLRLILKRIGNPQSVTIFDEDMDREGEQKATKKQETLFNAAKINTERVEITNRLLGISNFPVEVPDTVLEPHKEGFFEQVFDFIDGDKKRKITSITELLAWMVEQDSAVLGQFHQVIEFEEDFDGDGNARTEKLVLPNVAETLKELMLLIVQIANNDGTKIGLMMNTLAEVSNIKVQLFKTLQTVIDIQDYLDYPTNTREETVQLLCNLKPTSDQTDFEDFMQNSQVPVTFEDWNGSNSLHDNILDLLQVASMIRAQLFQRD